jgi:hypothetical protein
MRTRSNFERTRKSLSAHRLRCTPRYWHSVYDERGYGVPLKGRSCSCNATHGETVRDGHHANEHVDVPELYERTLHARRIRNMGLSFSLSIIVCAAAAAAVNRLNGMEVEYAALVAHRALVAAASVGGGCAATFWAFNDGNVHVEWHDGRLWAEAGVPPATRPAGESIAPSAVKVSSAQKLDWVKR